MSFSDVRIAVAKRFGVSAEDAAGTGYNVDQETWTKILDYSFAYVAQNPAGFSSREVAEAQQHAAAWGTDSPLLDASFDWSAFAREVENNVINAADDVSQIGKGVLTIARMGSWLIPAAALVFVGLVIWKYSKGQPLAPIK